MVIISGATLESLLRSSFRCSVLAANRVSFAPSISFFLAADFDEVAFSIRLCFFSLEIGESVTIESLALVGSSLLSATGWIGGGDSMGVSD